MGLPSCAGSARQAGSASTQPRLTETAEESLVADDRAGLTPAQLVERKLIYLLKANPLPVSQVMAGARILARR
jgi:hypothetical protein